MTAVLPLVLPLTAPVVLGGYSPWLSGQGGGVRPSTGAALLTWDGHASTLLIQWDGDDGLPRYLEWDT